MDNLINIWNVITSQNAVVFWVIATIILIVLYIVNIAKQARLTKRYNNVFKRLSSSGSDMEGMLKRYLDKVELIEQENKDISIYCKRLEKNILKCIQKVGMVRYNAFNDAGNGLSFALALLDYENNGVVINGIYSRDGSNTYAKPIINGTSTHNLSIEEQEAIEKAKNSIDEYVLNI